MRPDHAVLVEQRQPAGRFQHALDHEHHVRAAGVVFVEAERDVVLVGPGQDAVAEFGDLLAVLDDDRVLADQVDTADVAVEVDAHARPVEPRRHLLDMGRLAGAVIAGDDDAAVVGEAGQDRERGRRGRSGSPDRRRARARRPRNRPELPCRCRCRRAAGPTPSCRAWRRGGRFLWCGCHCSSVAPERRGAAISCRDSIGNGANLAEAGALRKPPRAWLKCRDSGPIVEESRGRPMLRPKARIGRLTSRPKEASMTDVQLKDRSETRAERQGPLLRRASSGAQHRRHEDDRRFLRRRAGHARWSTP